jgi:uncharacterized protein YkwD
MHRLMIAVSMSVSMSLLAAAAIAQEAPAPPAEEKETEKIVVIDDTGGEQRDASQPAIPDAAKAIVEQTNSFRKEHGRKPVRPSDELTKAAEAFAQYMARTGRYGHTADGQNPAQRVKEAGYTYCIVRENIAYAFRTQGFSTKELADQFVNGWEQSPGHRRNMLARWITGTGVAVAKSEKTDTYFAVQVFGRPQSDAVTFEVTNQTELTIEYTVGERNYTIKPGVTRTHEDCTPEQVAFLPLTEEGAASHPLHPVATLTSHKGDRMAIAPGENGAYQVKVETKSAPAESAPPGARP